MRVQLFAEVDSLRGGEEFLVGLRYRIAPHWHIYWKNPGDSGMPTNAVLDAPEGFEVGPLRYPGPQRFDLPGDITSYAYEDEVVLFWTVTAPEELGDVEQLRFEAESDWLVCRDICERGEGKSALSIPLAQEGAEVARDTDVFGSSLARLPRPFDRLTDASATFAAHEDSFILDLRVPGAESIEWFPEAGEGLSLIRDTPERGEGFVRLRRWYSFDPSEEHPSPRVRGVLAVRRDRETTFYEVDRSAQPTEETENR